MIESYLEDFAKYLTERFNEIAKRMIDNNYLLV